MLAANLGRFFLDTNVFIYRFDRKAPEKRRIADALIEEALAGRGLISYQVVQESLNVLSGAKRSITIPEIRDFLRDVLMPLCDVYPASDLFESALGISAETGWAFYDSLMVAAASSAKCDRLFTEDLQDGRVIRGVKIQNPFK